jgi:hypothetical protein
MSSWVAVGGAIANAELSEPRLHAFALSSDVYVDFAVEAPVVEGLDVGFLARNSTVVKWVIDLRPAGSPNVHYWWDRAIRRSTLEVIVRPSNAPGTCETIRQLNGRWLERRRVLSCTDAYRAISSFHVPVFTLTGVNPGPGPFDITVRAAVTSGRSVNVKTSVLARTRLIQPIKSQQ